MLSTIGKALGVLAATAIASIFSASVMAVQPIAFGETSPILINGWKVYNAFVSTPSITLVNGIVHFEGVIATAGSNPQLFVLPVGFRPANTVFVPIDVSGANNGRLQIMTDGTVTVQAQGGAFSKAAAYTSLEGAVFALNGTGATPLTLMNGWTNGPFGTANASVRNVGGIVYLAGGMATVGTNPVPFQLPASFAPANTVFVPVDLCDATNGRLEIHSNGIVTVEAEGGAFSNATCFTSLDGVSFARTAANSTSFSLINGWTGSPFGTVTPSVYMVNGVVHLEGAMATTGTKPNAFVLPSGFRPTSPVYVKVDLCNATNGDLFIRANGNVQVRANQFSNAQCFTSLDGASFAQ
jgi:hypothetical protein